MATTVGEAMLSIQAFARIEKLWEVLSWRWEIRKGSNRVEEGDGHGQGTVGA